jgi:Na+/pantothenate symporter
MLIIFYLNQLKRWDLYVSAYSFSTIDSLFLFYVILDLYWNMPHLFGIA